MHETAERWAVIVLLGVAALPWLSLAMGDGAWVGVEGSELPIKLWIWHTFPPGPHLFGGPATGIAFPRAGVLDNPDVVGSIAMAALGPLLGPPRAWATWLSALLLANGLSLFVLVRGLTGSARAAAVAGVAWALSPFTLTYGVASSISDLLHLWPYPLAVHFGLRSLGTGVRDGALAGLFVGLGFVTCPYDAIVFAPLLVPLLAGVALARGRPTLGGDLPSGSWRATLRAVAGAAVSAAVVVLPVVLVRQALLDDADSLMSADLVESTRHVAPYMSLHPSSKGLYTVALVDYLAVGAGGLSIRDNAARFLRAFGPGLAVLALALGSLTRAPRRRVALWPWWLAVGFFALASTGPYLVVSEHLALPRPLNLAWLGLHHLFPGSHLLLEPFRYALGVAMSACVLAGAGVAVLVRRWGTGAAAVALLAVLADLVLLSPAPLPLPTGDLDPPPWAAEADTLLPPGAILELPYNVRGSRLYARDHFSRQLAHGRPIPDEVHGTIARFIVQRSLLRKLVEQELTDAHKLQLIEVPPSFFEELAAEGLAGIVVRPGLYASPAHAALMERQLAPLGAPVERGGERIYALPSP